MRTFLIRAFLLAATAALPGIHMAQAADRPMIERSPFGAQIVWPNQPNLIPLLDRMEEAGIKWGRFDLCWWGVAETSPGNFDFNPTAHPAVGSWQTDNAIAAMKARDIEPFVILSYGNEIYETPGVPRDAQWIERYAEYCHQAALRYKDDIDYYEVWNEPNLEQFWGEGRSPRPDFYAQMAIRAAERIREADPDAVVVGAAVSGIDQNFLRTAFDNGLLDAVDAITVHPYRINSPESINTEIASVRQMISSRTDRTIPVWTGEWGYNECWSEITPRSKAKALARMFSNNLSQGIELSLWFSTHSFNEACTNIDPASPEWALIDWDASTRRPAMYAFQAANAAIQAPVEVTGNELNLQITQAPSQLRTLHLKNPNAGKRVISIWRATWPIADQDVVRLATVRFDGFASDSITVRDGLTGAGLPVDPAYSNGQWTIQDFRIYDYPVYLSVQ